MAPYQPLESLPGLFAQNRNNMTPVPTGGSYPTRPPVITATTPMGTKAVAPGSNTATATNAIPTNKVQTKVATPPPPLPTAPTTPPVDSSYPGIIKSQVNTGLYGTPQVQDTQKELQRYKDAYANAQAGLAQGGTDFNYYNGTQNSIANQYQQGLGSRETAVSNALASQGQRISALGNAGGLAAPVQVSPGNYYVNPQNARDASGGTITPGGGGARLAQVAQGRSAQENTPALNSAAGSVNEFSSTLHNSPTLLSSDFNIANLLHNIGQSNISDPNYLRLQTSFNNAINFYSQILGQTPDQLVSTLGSTSKGSTLVSLLNTIDAQARAYNQNLQNSSLNQNTAPTNINPAAPQNPANSQLSPTSQAILEKYGIK